MATTPTLHVPVEIVRPTRTAAQRWALILARILLMVFSVWIVMLALGALTPWHLSFWETWLAVLAFRAAQVPNNILGWTRDPKGGI